MYNAITSQVIVLGVTAKKLPTNPLVGRDYIVIQNVGSGTVYIGNSLVTANTAATGGHQILPSGEYIAAYTNKVDVYGIIAAGSSEVVVEEGN